MDNEKYRIIAALESGESPDIIAAQLNIDKAKVLRTKIQYDKAIISGTLDELVDVDELVLINAMRESQNQMPTLTDEIREVAAGMSKGADRLRKLDDELITTALFINTRIRSMAATVTSINEIEGATAALCRLRESFFNKNVTQVNIQNNLGPGQGAYGDWLNDKPN